MHRLRYALPPTYLRAAFKDALAAVRGGRTAIMNVVMTG